MNKFYGKELEQCPQYDKACYKYIKYTHDESGYALGEDMYAVEITTSNGDKEIGTVVLTEEALSRIIESLNARKTSTYVPSFLEIKLW